MLVQACWNKDSYLKQLPHFDADIIKRCQEKVTTIVSFSTHLLSRVQKLETVFDLLEVDDDVRTELLSKLSEAQTADVARYANRYPNIELTYTVPNKDDIKP